jgi:hypothetical protein
MLSMPPSRVQAMIEAMRPSGRPKREFTAMRVAVFSA